MDPALAALVQQHSDYFTVEPNGKILCRLNGHSLPPRLDAVSAFINGSKFQKLKQRQQTEEGLKRYEPFIVVSRNFPTMLYCALTGQLLDKTMDAVKRHMQGQKFKRAQEQFADDKQELKPEPTLESLGVQLPPSTGNGAAAAATGAAAEAAAPEAMDAAAEAGVNGNGDEPGFWAPEEGEADMMEGTSGGSDANEGADMMDEDQLQGSNRRSKPQLAADAAAGPSNASRRGSKSSKPGASKPGKAGRVADAEAGRTGAGGQAKPQSKRNINKPSAAKRARRADD